MGSFSDTPALIAGGTIAPFRFVKPSTSADDTGLQQTAGTLACLGVTDGSTKAFNSANHAESGDPITLQGGDVVLVEVGSGGVTRGDTLESDSSGKAITGLTTTTTRRYQAYVALQSGAAGEIVRAARVAGWNYYA